MTQALSIDAHRTALVMIDLQHGIVGRSLGPYGGPEVVARAKQLADAMRAKGAAIVWVRVLLNELNFPSSDAPTRAPDAPPAPAIASELVPEAGVQPGDIVVAKRQWGAFYGTDLELQLRRRGIDTIVLGGIATNFGVESTARAAYDRSFRLVFVEDATSSLAADMHQFTFEKLFRHMGHVRSTQQVIEALA
jgi:nicotinamidase-related amidase